MKACSKCKIIKNDNEFGFFKQKTSQGKTATYLNSRCIVCRVKRTTELYHERRPNSKWQHHNPNRPDKSKTTLQ
jgi:hypothetical protein